jgi:hypothetical protein
MRRCMFLLALWLTSAIAHAGQISMKLSALRALPEAEQRQVLRDGLKKRAEILSNVHVKAHVENYGAPYINHTIGKRRETLGRHDEEFWKIGDSYRFKLIDYPRDNAKPLFTSDSHFNAEEGVTRMLGKHSQIPYFQARIANAHDNVTRFNQSALKSLPGYVHGDKPTHLQYLLDNFEMAEVLDDASIPYNVPGTMALRVIDSSIPDSKDVRTFWVSPEKDFMLLRWESRYDSPKSARGYLYTDTWVVEDAEVDGLWMPKVVQSVSWSAQTKPDNRGAGMLTLQEIQIGKVKEADLQVVFPDGTEVIDDFTQKAYVVGKSDRPIPLVNLQGIAKHQPKRAWPWGILLNVAVVVGLVGLLIARRRRARLAAT